MTRQELYEKIHKVSAYGPGASDRSAYSVLSDVEKIVDAYCLQAVDSDVQQALIKNAELEAKVYAYEQIITKSNFSSFVLHDPIQDIRNRPHMPIDRGLAEQYRLPDFPTPNPNKEEED